MKALRRGSVGPAVAQLQRVLELEPDGIFGPLTERAVVDAQREKGLVADGVAGPRTLIALGVVQRDEQVTAQRTPIDAELYALGVGGSWRRQLGGLPTKAQLGVLWAQFMVETGGTHCYNFNLGNVKEIPGDGIPFAALHGVWEIIDGHRIELEPSDPGSWFSAFPSLEAGADFYLRKMRTRFASSWTFVLLADPAGFAHALKVQRYYTADERVYAAGLKAHHAAWMHSGHFEAGIAHLSTPPEPQEGKTAALPKYPPEPGPRPATVHPKVPLGRPGLDGEE